MRALREVRDRELRWVGRGWLLPTFELRAGDEIVAELRQSWWPPSIGTAAGERWQLTARGALRREVRIVTDREPDALTFRHDAMTMSGSLAVAASQSVRLERIGILGQSWEWRDPSGAVLISYALDAKWFRTDGRVTIAPAAGDHLRLPLLAVLGWFIIQRERNSSSA